MGVRMDLASDNPAASRRTWSGYAGLRVDRALELAVAFVLITGLGGLLATIAGEFHAPQLLLGALLLSGVYAYRTRERWRWPGPAPRWRHVIALLVLALFFRVPAYHYVMGGQDEGVYVNVAHYINHTGGIRVYDRVKQQLENTPYLDLYAADNRVSPDEYLGGVYTRDMKNSKLEFQFYDQFQVWMALFDGLFGAAFGVYALTFFALLSIVFFYRLTLLLTGSYQASLAAGILLTLNPLHVFFSKFPVTEVPALCFSLIGFTLLAALWSAPAAQRISRWRVLSVLAFLCLFTTRISGFMYVPFLIGAAIVSLLADGDAARRATVQRWAAGVAVAYLISVVYGLTWAHAYSHDIYSLSFEPRLGEHWKWLVALIAIGGLLIWGAAALAARSRIRERVMRPVSALLAWLPPFAVLAALALGAIMIYRLGWTQRYQGDPGLDIQWRLAGRGWAGASASSLWTLIVYLGPPLVLAFLFLIFKRNRDPRIGLLRWFVAGFWVFALVMQWVIPYSPYYARYLLSELVPYLILLVVYEWGSMRPGLLRKGMSLVVAFSIVYAGALSATQIGKSENDGAYAALARLTSRIDPGDLILLSMSGQNGITQSELKTPLLYTFHRQVVTVDRPNLANVNYIAELNSLYDDVYLISPAPQPPDGFVLMDSVRFKVWAFKPSHSFPHKLIPMRDVVLHLYRLDHLRVPAGTAISLAAWTDFLRSGWSPPESWGIWSLGTEAVLDFDTGFLPDQGHGLLIDLRANVFVTASHPVQRIEVSIDGKSVAHYKVAYPQTSLEMRIPVSQATLDSAKQFQIEFALPDAVSPRSLGMSADARQIALGLVSARFEPRTPVVPGNAQNL
ncbi:MAG TPA: hypothetical protein VFH71_02105 [Rhodanobacteraceae bacterium]|nr:hypothetical protein [Rhodanobacteraceae bacterium]